MSRIKINDVVQLKSNHRMKGCFGVVGSIDKCCGKNFYDISVPIPESGCERTVATSNQITRIGSLEVDHEKDEKNMHSL